MTRLKRRLRRIAREGKNWLRFWVPLGLIELRRRSHSTPVVQAQPASPVAPEVYAEFLLPIRSIQELFPGIEDVRPEIAISQIHVNDEWALPLSELLTLSAICRHLQPRRIFEIGSYTGLSTLSMALNTPADARIFTLDLKPETLETHKHGTGVGLPLFETGSFYKNTSSASKITQQFDDSRYFDYSDFQKNMDLVFVDGDHSYSFVKSDTEKAFEMLHSKGVIVWDDYRWKACHPECAGVTKCLDERKDTGNFFSIAGTRLAIYIPDM